MGPVLPVRPARQTSRLVTITVELSNARMDRGRRPRNRTEAYTLGVLPRYGPFSKKGDWNQCVLFDAIVRRLNERNLDQLLNRPLPQV
jgi:hypothetical protein